jgi:Mg2+ and Co2+ transporter CorA
MIFGATVGGTQYLITLHRTLFPWLDELYQLSEFAKATDYAMPLAKLLHTLLLKLTHSYQETIAQIDPFITALEDAARDGIRTSHAPAEIRRLVDEAKAASLRQARTARERNWIAKQDQDYLQALIFRTRRLIARMREIMLPERSAIHELVVHARFQVDNPHDAQRLIDERMARYFADIESHIETFDVMLQSRREQLSELINVHMSIISNRLNQIMRQLTIIANIFLPITFVTGFFGQNFWGTPSNPPFLADRPWLFTLIGSGGSVLALVVIAYFFSLYFRQQNYYGE